MTEVVETIAVETQAPVKRVCIPGPFPGTPENAYLTPLCKMGWHEGTNPEHICHGGGWWHNKPWVCRCSCHTIARKLPYGSDFEPPKPNMRDPYRVTLQDELRRWAREHAPVNALAPKRARVQPGDVSEESGRRAKGALEKQVQEVCLDYLLRGLEGLNTWKAPEDSDNYTAYLTPLIVAREIADRYNQDLPSEGAVRAVWYKWKDIGYAFIREKPLAFMLVTPLGTEIGLDGCKKRRIK